MYTDDDLNKAIGWGIFSQQAVTDFRQELAKERQDSIVDQEHFRLITGFNDIFVVIACLLVIVSANILLPETIWSYSLAMLIAWGLAEIFVRRRHMALPAIVLLCSFIYSSFQLGHSITMLINGSEYQLDKADFLYLTYITLIVFVAILLHWWRFRVAISIAFIVATGLSLVITLNNYFVPTMASMLNEQTLVAGIIAFFIAMYWDISDKERQTYRADVGFWLHLLAASLIVHAVFAMQGIWKGNIEMNGIIIVLLTYFALTLVSIVIDRRALMVTPLGYVMYALYSLFYINSNDINSGQVMLNISLASACMGVILLFLSVFWHNVRSRVMVLIPASLKANLPAAN